MMPACVPPLVHAGEFVERELRALAELHRYRTLRSRYSQPDAEAAAATRES